MDISFVIPAYNEEKAIPVIIDRINKLDFNKHGYSFEILIVDNNSKDNTSNVSKKLGARVVFEKNQGYGYAYKRGFREAKGDIIITGDADDTYPFEDSLVLINYFNRNNLDFLTTNRFKYMAKDAMGLKNKIGNQFFLILVNFIFRLNLKDSWSGMWIFKRSILKRLKLKSNGMELSQEIKLEAFKKCSRVSEVPIKFNRERIGIAKLEPWKDGLKTLKYLFKRKFHLR